MSQIDPNINQRAAANPVESVWVAASAGTGKTKVLADRVLNLLLKGCPPEKILCLTFTKAAAAQMENRIAARLAKWAGDDDAILKAEVSALILAEPSTKIMARARQLFATVLEAKGGMKILTIHSFCQSVLKRFPLEAGVSPNFEVMDEGDATELLERVIAKSIHSEALQDELKILSLYVDEDELINDLKAFDSNRAKFAAVLQKVGSLDGFLANLYTRYGVDAKITEEHITDEIIKLPANIGEIAEILAGAGKRGSDAADAIVQFLALDEEGKKKNYQLYELGFLGKTTGTIPKLKVYEKPPVADEAWRVFEWEEKRKAAALMRAMTAFLKVADTVLFKYKESKIHDGLLDYADLILKTRDLLRDQGAAWVLYKLDGGLEHILVDEAQDTSAEQWEIVQALADEFFAGVGASPFVRTIFAVGDKKQSIFSFQGANPKKFAQSKSYFDGQLQRVGKELKTIPLAVSFRSASPVIELVNRLLTDPDIKNAMAEPNEDVKHEAFREDAAGLVELWPSMAAEPDDVPEAWQPPIDRVKTKSAQDRLAKKIAAKIADMIQNDVLPSQGRKVLPKDIMILLRSRGAFFEKLVRELKSKQVPVTGMDKMKITQQIAVMDLMALGDFLLLPEDDLNLAGLLKSPLFGFDEDELYDVCFGREPLSVWENLKRKATSEKNNNKYLQTVDTLKELLDMADKVLPSYLFDYVLSALGGRKKIIQRLGFDAADAIFDFITLALEFEETNTPSLQGFLAWLKARDVEIKRDLDQGEANAVRITTVHSSKGLEAPIIFLPDTKKSGGVNKERLYWLADENELEIPLWFVDSDNLSSRMKADKELAKQAMENEGKRLLYVAVTRPQDRLYITGWNRKNEKSEKDLGEEGAAAAKSKSTAKPTWYDFIKSTFNETEATKVGEDKIFFLSSDQKGEPKQEHINTVNPECKIPAWVSEMALPEEMPPKPLAPSEFGGEDDVLADSPANERNAIGLKRGQIVHKLLQFLPDVPLADRKKMMQKYLSLNLPEANDAERKTIEDSVTHILEDVRFKKFFGPGSKAEVPLIGMLGNKAFSGQVDRLWVGENEVTVIDYKTNQNVPGNPEAVPELYKTQLAVYKQLLQKLFKDKKVQAFILWTKDLSFMEM